MLCPLARHFIHLQDDKPDSKTLLIFFAWLPEKTGLHLHPLTRLNCKTLNNNFLSQDIDNTKKQTLKIAVSTIL